MARLPKSLIKKYGISKKAWSVFKSRGRKASRPKTKTTRRRVGRRMVRRWRRRRRRGGKSMTTTVFKLVRLGALAVPAASIALDNSLSGRQKMIHGLKAYTGFDMHDGKWYPAELLKGWGPYLGATLATYGIPKIVGIIRKI